MPMKRKLFMRYLLFYLCFLLVLILMYVPFHQTSLHIVREKSLKTSESMLESGLNQFERELEQIRALATSLATDADILTAGHITLPPTGRDVYKAYRAQETFGSLVSVMPTGMQLCMLMPNDIVLADRYIFYGRNELYKFVFDSQFKEASQWLSYINGFSGPSHLFPVRQISVMGKMDHALVYSCRVPLASNSTKQLLFSVINADHVSSLLSLSGIYEDTALILSGEDGTTLLQLGAERPQEQYATIDAASKSGFPLSARLLVPESVFSAQLVSFNRMYLFFILSFVLVGAIVAVVLSYRSSRPVLKLLDNVKGYVPENVPKSKYRGGDVYQYLESYLEGTENRFRDYTAMLDEQAKMLRSYTFQRIATKPDPDETEFMQAKHYFSNFPARYRLVSLSMNMDLQQELDRFSSCQVVLMSIVTKELPLYTAQFLGRHLLVVVSDEVPKEKLDSALLRIRTAFDDAANAEITVTVSEVVNGIEMLDTARRQTQFLLRVSVKPITYMEETDYEMPYFSSSRIFHSANRFYHYILNADGFHAAETMDECARYMASCHTVNHQYTAILFHMFYVQLLRLNEEMALPELKSAQLPEYDPMVSIEVLMKPIRDYALRAAGIIAKHRDMERSALADKVLGYIDDNIGNADMCLSLAADQLNMTENEIKRILSNAVNRTFFDYLDTKRMTLARDLLLNTDQSISEIMETCGYRSLNTLYKAFRRTYGVSPSMMRNQQKGRE